MHLEQIAHRRNASLMNVIGAHKFHPSVRPKGLSIAVLAAGIIWALCVPYTVSGQTGFNGPGPYEITNSQSGKVLDLDRRDGTSVIQFSSQGTDNQRWAIGPAGSGLYYIRNTMNGNVLEAVRTGNSTSVRATPFKGGSSQQWRLDVGQDGRALITSQLGKTLDFLGGMASDGAPVRMYNVTGGANQRFMFRRVSGGLGAGNDGWGGDSGWGSGRNSSGNSNNSTTVTCSSDDGQRVHCNADTRSGVRLARQISGAPCDQGSTWGYDSTGVWVDRGCRAEFDVAGRGSTVNSSIIACSSENGRRVYCDADTSHGVRLARQMGASSCDQGSSWGYDSRGVWVDRGCSAEFDVSGRTSFGQTRTIAAGTSITVRNNEPIDVRQTDGRMFSGVVYQDVLDAHGNVAIPRGSDAELTVRTDSNQDLALDLESVTVNGQRYALTAHSDRLADGQKDGIGQNKRTAEYVGGGALLGTIIGAIAGGGKGAAIGAAAGAAAGAGTQVLTRGKTVNVPAESLLTFRLERTLEMGAADGGFDREGRHYHDPNR
jgi:hypothetical protein